MLFLSVKSLAMAANSYDFEDFLATSKNGFRLYNNNFAGTKNGDIAPAYTTCGEKLLVLSACLRLLHEDGINNPEGLFSGQDRQAKVERCVARIGDFRSTVEDLGSLMRKATRNGKQAWESLRDSPDRADFERLCEDMDKQAEKIQDLLVVDEEVTP
jgi:hypothetical protein